MTQRYILYSVSWRKRITNRHHNSFLIESYRKEGKIYFCVDDPNPPYNGVRGKGSVRIHEDIEFNVPIAEKTMVMYLGKIDHPMAQAPLNMQKIGQ